MPGKLKKPATSITAVNTIDEDFAGSLFMAVKNKGIAAPKITAITFDSPIQPAITSSARVADFRPAHAARWWQQSRWRYRTAQTFP